VFSYRIVWSDYDRLTTSMLFVVAFYWDGELYRDAGGYEIRNAESRENLRRELRSRGADDSFFGILLDELKDRGLVAW
jgi:hypothetical protein